MTTSTISDFFVGLAVGRRRARLQMAFVEDIKPVPASKGHLHTVGRAYFAPVGLAAVPANPGSYKWLPTLAGMRDIGRKLRSLGEYSPG